MCVVLTAIKAGNSLLIFRLDESRGLTSTAKRNCAASQNSYRSIASDASKSQVLKRLTDRFPSEPHFWNHRGRFASMEDSNHPLAIECSEKATSLAEEDPLHWHSLGMVHRYEVRRRLQNLRGGSDQSLEKAVEGHSHVQEAFDRAAASFEKARNVAPEDEYGYITHIQIIEETIRALDSLAGASDAMPLLKDQSLGGWCRQQLQLAEWLMWSARILSAHRDEPSARLLRLEGSVKALYGRFDEVIEYFEDALNEPNSSGRSHIRTPSASICLLRARR